MKKAFLFIVATVLFTACHKQTFDERLIAETEHFNTKEAPKRLDYYTSFDSMSYDRDTQVLTYFYTMSNEIDEQILPADEFKQKLLENLRNSLTLKPHKDHNINFHYVYYSEATKKPLIDCTFVPEDYK